MRTVSALKILITDKCTMAFKKWREKGESFRVDRSRSRYRCIEGRCLHQIMSAKTKVTKTKTALKQATYNLSDLKHDLHCGFVELGPARSRCHRNQHHRPQNFLNSSP